MELADFVIIAHVQAQFGASVSGGEALHGIGYGVDIAGDVAGNIKRGNKGNGDTGQQYRQYKHLGKANRGGGCATLFGEENFGIYGKLRG